MVNPEINAGMDNIEALHALQLMASLVLSSWPNAFRRCHRMFSWFCRSLRDCCPPMHCMSYTMLHKRLSTGMPQRYVFKSAARSYSVSSDISCRQSPKVQEAEKAMGSLTSGKMFSLSVCGVPDLDPTQR